jgi:hypothetical protein
MNLTKLYLLIWLIVASGVSTNQSVSQAVLKNEIPKDTIISLERTRCFGTCPSYKLTISANGTVVFEGHQYVKQKGRVKDHISEDKLRELISEFEKINYFSSRNKYEDEADGCPVTATDMSSAITGIRISGRTKVISHYLGCWEKDAHFKVYPRELFLLENKIDEIVGTKKWVE